jgi:hypothetical protein
MASFYTEKQLERMKKRVSRGLDIVTMDESSVRANIVNVAFAAYSLKRRYDIEGEVDDILTAIQTVKGYATTNYFLSFARNLYQWMTDEFAELPDHRFKATGHKQLEMKVLDELKRMAKERQLQLSLAKKQRAEFEREYNRTSAPPHLLIYIISQCGGFFFKSLI